MLNRFSFSVPDEKLTPVFTKVDLTAVAHCDGASVFQGRVALRAHTRTAPGRGGAAKSRGSGGECQGASA